MWRCSQCGWSAPTEDGIPSCLAEDQRPVGYDAAHFTHLAPVEAVHFWFVARNALLTWALHRYFPDAASFLEVGCGSGQVTLALQRANPGLHVTGTDAFMEGLRIARQRVPEAEFVQADVRRLPFDAEFDLVGSFDVLEHVAEHEQALDEMVRAVKPGGGVVITVPQHAFLWSAMDVYAGHVRRYSRGRLTQLLESRGLQVERATSFVSLLLPLMLALRMTQRRTPARWEFGVHPGFNEAALSVMAVERVAIRAGLSLPFGGSVLIVARRSR